MTLYRTLIRNKAFAILGSYLQPGRTLIGQRWPVEMKQLPCLLLDLREETKTEIAGNTGEPKFGVRATMAVRARMAVTSEPDAAPLGIDHGPAIEAACDEWIEKIQDALLCDADFPRMFSSIPGVTVQTAAEAGEEQLVAEVMVTFTLAWTEAYPPRVDDELALLHLRVDAIDPQDPAGTYPQAEGFPAAAPPLRERGPDGRAEIGADIPIPTD